MVHKVPFWLLTWKKKKTIPEGHRSSHSFEKPCTSYLKGKTTVTWSMYWPKWSKLRKRPHLLCFLDSLTVVRLMTAGAFERTMGLLGCFWGYNFKFAQKVSQYSLTLSLKIVKFFTLLIISLYQCFIPFQSWHCFLSLFLVGENVIV